MAGSSWGAIMCGNGFLFPMGYWDNMVMGHSCRNDQPPLVSREEI
jgi:hypothetical protein